MVSGTKCLPVTVAIPVKNEAENLPRCLERLYQFAEVVVIDSNSTDETADIAREFGAKVLNFRWNGRYPKKRNWMLLNNPPSQDWVLFLDADEFIDSEFCEYLRNELQHSTVNGYWLSYSNFFLGRKLRWGVKQKKLALFRVGSGMYERVEEDYWSNLDMEVHEHPLIEGEVGEISVPIEHRDYKGLDKFIERHKDYAKWEANRYQELQERSEDPQHFTRRQRFKYRYLLKWWYPWFYFIYAYVVKLGFLDGSKGFYYAFFKLWYFQTIRLLARESNVSCR